MIIRRVLASRVMPIAQCLLLVVYCLLPMRDRWLSAAEPESLAVYAPQARFRVPVMEPDGKQYVGLLELLEPLTQVELKKEGSRWKLRIRDPKAPGRTVEAEFQPGGVASRVRGKAVTLSAPARDENQRLFVPLHGIGAVLIPLLGTDFVFHESSRRMFIDGSAQPLRAELHKGEPGSLELHFVAPVSPSIHSEGNSVKLMFSRDPVVSFTEHENLNDKLFSSTTYAENNGMATVTVNGSAPLLAKFADGGKTIIVEAAPPPPTITASTPPQTPSPTTRALISAETTPMSTAAESSTAPATQTAHRTQPQSFLVVIDPAHGGQDTGARIAADLPEKESTLSLARKLRQELQSRHIATMLLRDGDSDLSLDQRVVAANLARAAAFVSLHAEPGSSLRIYTNALPVTVPLVPDRNSFVPWQSAQASFLSDSRSLANAAAEMFSKRDIEAQVRPAFVQPLHSIAAPAIAIEAPADHRGLRIAEDRIAAALAEAISSRKQNAGAPQ